MLIFLKVLGILVLLILVLIFLIINASSKNLQPAWAVQELNLPASKSTKLKFYSIDGEEDTEKLGNRG